MGFLRQKYWSGLRSSRPRDQTRVSCSSCIAGGFFTAEPPGKPYSFRKIQVRILDYKTLKYCHLVLVLYLSLPPSWYCAYYGRLRKSFLTRVKWLRVQQLICINRRMKPKALLSRSGGEGPLTVLPVVEKFCVWLHFIRGLSTCHSTTLWYTQNVTKNKFFHLCSLVCITNCFSWESSGLIGDVFSYDWRIICWLSGAVVLNLFEGHTPWGFLKSISPFQMYINNPYLKPLLYFMIEYVRQ